MLCVCVCSCSHTSCWGSQRHSKPSFAAVSSLLASSLELIRREYLVSDSECLLGPLSLSLSLSFWLTLSLSLSPPPSLSHTHTYTHSLSMSLFFICGTQFYFERIKNFLTWHCCIGPRVTVSAGSFFRGCGQRQRRPQCHLHQESSAAAGQQRVAPDYLQQHQCLHPLYSTHGNLRGGVRGHWLPQTEWRVLLEHDDCQRHLWFRHRLCDRLANSGETVFGVTSGLGSYGR